MKFDWAGKLFGGCQDGWQTQEEEKSGVDRKEENRLSSGYEEAKLTPTQSLVANLFFCAISSTCRAAKIRRWICAGTDLTLSAVATFLGAI